MRKRSLGIAVAIYLVTLAMNIAGLPRFTCDWGNHAFVFACLLFCLQEWRYTHDNLLLAFMGFTLVADIATGFSEAFALGGVLFFASQIVMSFIIWRNNGGRRGWTLRIALTAAGFAAIAAAGALTPMYAFGVIYFMWFLANAIQAVAARDWDNLPIRMGLVLYLIGDICLIANLFVPDSGVLTTVLTYGTWMPYLPAVFMISLSGERDADMPLIFR